MENRYVCIHGHFYQPPRENPWLEDVELQDSAYPHHDWNERITSECYAPNAASRIFDPDGRIQEIVNNYARMSFDFGPTLLSWMERHSPLTYQLIIEADRDSRQRFGGHGAAIAQAYNHIILPLANERDKRTEVLWGLRDFEHRFGRCSEGMWLPETAADTATLEVLAGNGMRFTILAPQQARQVRPLDGGDWQDVTGGKIDPRRAYLFRLPSGRSIALFFYDGLVSHEAGFGEMLNNGDIFAKRLAGTLDEQPEAAQLAHVATDGETYSHHHRYADMALAYCLHRLETDELARLTVYGEFLDRHPPVHEVRLHEPSSWSCPHGVGRWHTDCGCRMRGDWHQQWRQPLRDALDYLRDTILPIYEKRAERYLNDPWAARDDYIRVILDRSEASIEAFLAQHASRHLHSSERVDLWKLLEMQRHCLLMYTSCGWFFDEVSRPEPVQCLQYAAAAMQLARQLTGTDLEEPFLTILANGPSNLPDKGDGANVFRTLVTPAVVDLHRVGAHFAVSSLFEQYSEPTTIYAFTAWPEDYDRWEGGEQKLAVGRTRVRSDVLGEEYVVDHAVLYFGGHNLNGAIRSHAGGEAYHLMKRALREAFRRGEIAESIRLMNQHFGTGNYSLRHLFRDEQTKLIHQVLQGSFQMIRSTFRSIYDRHYAILLAMKSVGMPLPPALATPAEFVLNADLTECLRQEDLDPSRIERLVGEIRQWGFRLDETTLSFVAMGKVNEKMLLLLEQPDDLALLEAIRDALQALRPLPLELNLWTAQNAYFALARQRYPQMRQQADNGSKTAQQWAESFRRLGQDLKVRPE